MAGKPPMACSTVWVVAIVAPSAKCIPSSSQAGSAPPETTDVFLSYPLRPEGSQDKMEGGGRHNHTQIRPSEQHEKRQEAGNQGQEAQQHSPIAGHRAP